MRRGLEEVWREGQRARRMNGNLQLLGAGRVSRKSQRPGMREALASLVVTLDDISSNRRYEV